VFHPNVNKYEQVKRSVQTPPDGAITHGGPAPVTAASPAPATPDSNQTVSPADTPGNSEPVSTQQSSGTAVNNTTDITIGNTINSNATTGNATGHDNYIVGNATSGNAAAVANIINLIQSSAGLAGPGLATFTRDIQGDVNGDLLIDPAALLQATATPEGFDGDTKVDIHNTVNADITNDVNLNAKSGNASLTDNYTAGNAATGTAAAVANVVNLINSVIAANQSFLGVVNIYGSYTGNILVPQSTLDSLLASNAPSSATSQHTATAVAHLSNSADQTITNNIDLSATTGSATQRNNTTTGSATSGDAMTNLTILNLTNHQVDASNSLLVFVNVLGKWVGVIMDAPAGATSAALTGGATKAAENALASGEKDITNTTNAKITNNITAHAASGDATVANNFHSGNATSGNASASANILNIVNTAFNVSNWFGILFINVFGNWLGNFGMANPQPTTGGGGTGNSTSSSPSSNPGSPSTPPAVFRFVPTGGSGSGSGGGLQRVDDSYFANAAAYTDFVNKVHGVLAANDIDPTNPAPPTASQSGAVKFAGLSFAVIPLVIGLGGFAAIGAEKIYSIRKRAALATFSA
jgi:hypothetical protein